MATKASAHVPFIKILFPAGREADGIKGTSITSGAAHSLPVTTQWTDLCKRGLNDVLKALPN